MRITRSIHAVSLARWRSLVGVAPLAARADVSDRQRSAQRTQARHATTRARQRRACASSRSRRKPAQFDTARGLTFINSDLAFRDHYVYQGNFAGFTIWDVKNPAKPELRRRRVRASRRRAIRRSSATCSSSRRKAAAIATIARRAA